MSGGPAVPRVTSHTTYEALSRAEDGGIATRGIPETS